MDGHAVPARYLHVRLLIAIAVCACSSPKRPASTPTVPTPYPASLYAGLFVKGARQTYAVESSVSHWDDQDPRADKDGNVVETFKGTITCTVTDVREVPSAIASRIECEDTDNVPLVGEGPGGIYVATADGLWSVGEMPRVAPTTTEYQLFAWPPVPGRTEQPDPKNPGWGTTVTISESRGTWCRYFTFITAHDGDEEICVGGGRIVRGAASSSGGESRTMRYALVEP